MWTPTECLIKALYYYYTGLQRYAEEWLEEAYYGATGRVSWQDDCMVINLTAFPSSDDVDD